MSRRMISPMPEAAAVTVPRYRSRVLDETRHDPYQLSAKPIEPTRCGECGAVFHRGRWSWVPAPERSHVTSCPACRRIRDRLPAGFITLEGVRTPALRAELLRLVHNQAERERSEHPMHRIMRMEARDDRIELATTDIHLPQRVGRAIKRAFHGTLDIHYGDDEYTVRIHWHA